MMEESTLDGKVTPYLLLCAAICFLGSPLQFGYNLAVINAPEGVIKKHFHDVKHFESFLWPFAVSIFAIGGMVGAFVGPQLAKKYGRKRTLLLNNIIVIIGGVLLFCTEKSHSVTVLCLGRIIVGLNAGANTVISPMYLSEIAPVHVRGSLGTLSQFGIVTGILLGNILGMKVILGNEKYWPYLLGLTAIIGVIQFLLLPLCPESPRWLLSMQKDEEAIAGLQKLRGVEDVSAEVDEIKLEAARESCVAQVSVVEIFRNSYYHKPLLISVVMQMAQQLSGIGGILYYSTSLFVKVGMDEGYSQAATCGVGALSVIMTIVVIFLVEKAGRRILMLVGLGGMSVLYIFVTICFYYVLQEAKWAKIAAVVATLASVAVFQSGPGAIPWFIVSELFSQSSISAAISVAGPVNWLSNFVVGLLFPLIDKGLYPYTFIPFVVLLIIFFTFTYFVVPETKGRTIAEINAEIHGAVLENQRASENLKI